jgi:hypothetical protein
VPKSDDVANLERRQKALEEEIARALAHWLPDDPMIIDLKRRMLHLRDELERFRDATIQGLHPH